MTTVELRRKQILCMLGAKEEDYTEETLQDILAIGSILYNLREMQNIFRNHQEKELNNNEQERDSDKYRFWNRRDIRNSIYYSETL